MSRAASKSQTYFNRDGMGLDKAIDPFERDVMEHVDSVVQKYVPPEECREVLAMLFGPTRDPRITWSNGKHVYGR